MLNYYNINYVYFQSQSPPLYERIIINETSQSHIDGPTWYTSVLSVYEPQHMDTGYYTCSYAGQVSSQHTDNVYVFIKGKNLSIDFCTLSQQGHSTSLFLMKINSRTL